MRHKYYFSHPQYVLLGISDFREVLPLKDVLRSAITMSGVQCVMIYGVLLMLKWSVDS